jgi:hypothetical protein
VRRNGFTALICAARYNVPAIVGALVGACADVSTKENSGCAFPAWLGVLAVADARAAPSGRWTALHYAAHYGFIGAAVPLLVGGADQRITDKHGYAVSPTAKQLPHTIGPIGAGKRLAKQHKLITSSPSTTQRWRRCGHRIARALLLLAPSRRRRHRRARPHATHAPPQYCMPRPRSSAYADAPAA